MRIKVLCSDKSRGYVRADELNDLIDRGIVVAFSRPGSDEWIDAKKFRHTRTNVSSVQRVSKNTL